MATTGWLRCDSVREGMFTDELAVVVSRSNGAEESYFVPASAVERSGNRLRVDLRESGSLYWATLPTSEPTTIPVSKARVEVK